MRGWLEQQLPEYMVPGVLVELERLPLTGNGKVDRKALPKPEGRRGKREEERRERTAVEELVAGIWSEVLKVEAVGLEENFFQLGGHSLLATQVVSRVRKVFGVELELRSLFEGPMVSKIAEEIEKRLKAEGSGRGRKEEGRKLERVSREGELELSFAQQRLWFIDQLEPGSSAYNVPLGVRLRGKLKVEALERAIGEIVRRHEVLRTTFPAVGGEPRQRIGLWEEMRRKLRLEIVDLAGSREQEAGAEASGTEEARVEEAARRLAMEEARTGFDLGEGPLMRVKLLRLGEEEHVLLVTLHHIVSDGWSLGVLVKEFAALYGAYVEGKESPLEELKIQYADYAQWQREWLRGEVLEEQLGYWREQLAGMTPLELPTDHPRPAFSSGRGEWVKVVIGRELTRQLEELSRRAGVTVFMTLLAGFQVLLGRYSQQQDVAVGTAVANRTRLETEELIGFLVNTLVLRSHIGVAMSFQELMWEVRGKVLGAYAHQELPFERLVEELAPERKLGRTPLVQAVFALQNGKMEEQLRMPGVEIREWEGGRGEAKFEVTLLMRRGGEGLEGVLQYAADVFGRERMERMEKHWVRLLEEGVKRPEGRVWEMSLLGEEERVQLLYEWNRTEVATGNKTVQEWVEEQAAIRPESEAVVFGEERLTYRELNARANQLAHYLRKRGVKTEAVIAVFCERSIELIIGLLGTVKAGGAYASLDMANPAERLQWLLEDSGAEIVLTQKHLASRLPEQRAQSLFLDSQWEEIASESRKNPDRWSGPENLVYVSYTSGSTGRPKGVAIAHRGVERLARETKTFRIEAQDTVLQLSPVSFDASTLEIWGTLMNGARLAVFAPHMPSLEELGRFAKEKHITVMWLTAGLFQQIAESELERLRGVKQLLAGGDVLSPSHIDMAHQALPGCALINGYGPTENTTFTACYRIAAQEEGEAYTNKGSVPIGKPIANTRLYVLDEQMQLVPVGVIGELYVGGAGVARGYWRRPELTGERFVPDGYGAESGGRLYRTGDMVRWRGDGNLEFMGRKDEQVKLRGYRIELGEIEAVLLKHEQIGQAVVVLREDQRGDKGLVGYVVRRGEREIEEAEVRGWLEQQLPEYMVPGELVELEKIPLTGNGKVDRKALPKPEGRRGKREEERRERTAVEELVAGIWSEVLKVEAVGLEENFFQLGGHSLLATQVVSRVRKVFGVELELRSLFEGPMVSKIAEEIEKRLKAEGSGRGRKEEGRKLERVSREGELELSFAQQRLWFIDQLEPGSSAYNVPLGVRLRGKLKVEALERAIGEIVRRHEVLRTTFPAVGGEPRQRIGLWEEMRRKLRLEIVDLAGSREQEAGAEASGTEEARVEEAARRLAMEEARTGFDLGEGPLMRVKLLRLGEEEHVLLVTLHHIVSDGWSLGVLVKEFAALYGAYVEGKESPLEELKIQYADYAQWQREWLRGEVLEEQLGYWREQLAGMTPLELPTDHPRPAFSSGRGEWVKVVIGRELTRQLEELSRRAGVTVFMTLLAGFQVLLGRYSQQQDVAVGTAVANRTRLETEELIGFLVNTLVLRSHIGVAMSFQELMWEVRGKVLGAYAHQELPFERLVEELAPERKLGRTPLVQAVFALQNGKMEEQLRMPGVEIREWEGGRGEAKFEVTLLMRRGGEGLEGVLQYAADVFGRERMERMEKHWVRLLEEGVKRPEGRVWEMSLLGEEERVQLLYEWNRTEVATGNKTVQEWVEEQAAIRPESEAVVFGEERLTYRELNARANQLAHYLRKRGVGPEVWVGICLERRPEMIVGLLGILKSGGAYVPLEPRYPNQRLAYLAEDAQLQVLVTQQKLKGTLLPGAAEIVCIDEDWEKISAEASSNPVIHAHAGNAAYVIYTSGSTGLPKGVVIEHHSLMNYLCWVDQFFRREKVECMPAISSLAFDASLKQILWPLAMGGKVLLVDDVASEPLRLLQLVRREKAALNCIPSLWNSLLEIIEGDEGCKDLTHLFLSGEGFTGELVNRSLRAIPNLRIFNLYGPTEATANSTHATGITPQNIVLGKPIANTRLYVLDEQMQLVPVGVIGELYVGGAGVARGYWRRPELTGERFVPDGYGAESGGRLYRTGDMVRWRGDGNLEFMGRKDEQVKLRGYRIELGEIEAVLLKHEQIGQAVVVLREDQRGDKGLVGYVVRRGEREIEEAEVRGWLEQQLPEYMVPGELVELEKIPLTGNGKVDRKALPKPEGRRGKREEERRERTAVEELVAGIWSEVLKVEAVGLEENFFQLGGHSLLATQVVSRVRKVFGVELELRSLFEGPMVSKIAEEIEKRLKAEGSGRGRKEEGRKLERVSREGELELSFAQQRLWFIDQLEPGSSAYNVPLGVRLRGKLKVEALERAIGEIVRRHEVLRTTFPAVGGEPRQRIAPFTGVPIQVVDFSKEEAREEKAREWAFREAQRPFNLAEGPLLRVLLLRLGEDDHVLLATCHHIVSDGWSLGVLIREFAVLYSAYAQGKPSPLEELEIQYVDFAHWHRQWLSGETLENLLDYWRKTLAGMREFELPGDWPRRATLTDEGETLAFEIPAELTQSLKQLARKEGVTLFMALLAGFQVVLGSYAGCDEVVIGTDVANRQFKETEALIGFFVNQLVIRTSLAEDAGFRDFLRRAQKAALGATVHQDLPFERLVEELAPERSLDRSPLFQIKMVFQNVPEESMRLQGLQLELWRAPAKAARFDLTLTLHEEQNVLAGHLNYRTGLFKAETIHLLQSQFVSLLERVIRQPEVQLSDLRAELASAMEKHKIESNRRIERLLESKLTIGKRKIITTGA